MRQRRAQEGSHPLGGARIIHEDGDILVVDKPPGLVSALPEDLTGSTLFSLVKQYARARRPRRGPRPVGGSAARGAARGPAKMRGPAVWIIHRLDRDASGLLVFALSHRAFLALKDQLKRRQVRRRYVAVVEGELPPAPHGPWKWIDAFLADAGPRRPVRFTSAPGDDRRRGPRAPSGPAGPVRAVTYYRILASGGGRSLLELRLDTGRKHQIRAHLASIGHPVVDDRLYGGAEPAAEAPPSGRLALHAFELAFSHPATGQLVRFVSPPPGVFFSMARAKADVLNLGAEPSATGEPSAPRRPAPPRDRRDQGAGDWDHVAGWYEDLIAGKRSDYHEELILPGILRLLEPRPGQRILDVACGEGVLSRRLAGLAVRCVGADASERLIAAGRRLAERLPQPARPLLLVGDARRLMEVPELANLAGQFDAAACMLALPNIDPFEPVVRGVAELLRPGGRFAAVILHPAFRAPGLTSWGWESQEPREDRGPPKGRKGHRPGRRSEMRPIPRQYRRVDAYLSIAHRSIVMNPGEVADGRPPITTVTWHRPIQAYVKALAESGLLLDALEEWPSHRTSEPGPRAAEEDRARREIPMFLALRARRA